MQLFFESAVVVLSLAGSFAVAVIVQKTALGLLLSAMGSNGERAAEHGGK